MRNRLAAALLVIVAGLAPALGVASRAGAVDVTGPPRISIGGGSIVEGHMNRRWIRFIVTLSWAAPAPISVNFATGDPSDSATPGSDYLGKSGTILFKATQRVRLLAVRTYVDINEEPDESFTLRLSNPIGATIAVADATGTIYNDDPPVGRQMSIGDGVVPEECVGKVQASVLVTLSSMSGAVEVVHVATSPADTAGATAGVDYVSVNRDVTFFIGNLVKEIKIPIYGDLATEGPEQIKVTLTTVSGTTPLLRSEGTVTILDCQPT